MSLHPHVVEPVPEETARVAQAAFPADFRGRKLPHNCTNILDEARGT